MDQKQRRKSYTVIEKLNAIKMLKENNNNISKTAREVGISNKMLREWRTNESKLLNAPNIREKRKIGCGPKAKFPEIEAELKQWITTERLVHKRAVSYNRLIEEAKKIGEKLKIEFSGTKRWARLFAKRSEISLRKITHIGQQDNRTSDVISKIVNEYLDKLEMSTGGLQKCTIFNMDETPVYIDMMSSYTLSFKGEKNTEAVCTGHLKTRFTVVLCISASGNMLKAMVIIKGLKNVPKCNIPENITVVTSPKGTMNESIMVEWINRCFCKRGNFLCTTKSLLLMDQFAAHKMDSILSKLKSLNTAAMFIPAKTTHFLQPLDVSINGPFKQNLKHQWENWLCNGVQDFTSKGYRKKPNWETVLQFVSNAMKSIKSESIIKSFEVCGILELGQRFDANLLNNKLQCVLLGSNTEGDDDSSVNSDFECETEIEDASDCIEMTDSD